MTDHKETTHVGERDRVCMGKRFYVVQVLERLL